MKLYILSRGRADRVLTVGALPLSLVSQVSIVVRPDEYRAYRDAGWMKITVLDKGVENIGQVRQWVIENAREEFIGLLDDDIAGFNFKPVMSRYGGLRNASAKEIETAFATVATWLKTDKLVHAALAPRFLAALPCQKKHTENYKLSQCMFFDRKKLLASGARFDRVPIYEDIDLTLQLLQRGYPNRILLQCCFNPNKAGARGGCATYRTPDVKRKTVERLKKFYRPDILSIDYNEKANKITTRTHWKKAFNQKGEIK